MKRNLKNPTIKTGYLAALVLAGAGFGQTIPANPHALEGLMPNSAVMSAGHPPLEQLNGLGAATTPKTTGALNVHVIPGTAGGVVTADDAVTVELYHRGSPLKKMDVTLDASGKVTVGDLPLMPPVQALVSVKHAGLLQQVVSPELNLEQPLHSIQIKVFDTTEEQPTWNIAMQHIIVQWAQDGTGARVTEMISASTPGDRVWLGTKVGDKRVTMTIPLPSGIDDVELGGSFDEQASRIADGKLVTGGALFPGRSEFRITYTVAAKDGTLELPITTPAPVGSLIVFLPADDVQVTAVGLTGGNAVDMGEGVVRMYKAQNLAAGATALLTVKGIKPAAMVDPEGLAAIKPVGLSARNVAMGGAFLIALIGAGMILIKKPQAKKA